MGTKDPSCRSVAIFLGGFLSYPSLKLLTASQAMSTALGESSNKREWLTCTTSTSASESPFEHSSKTSRHHTRPGVLGQQDYRRLMSQLFRMQRQGQGQLENVVEWGCEDRRRGCEGPVLPQIAELLPESWLVAQVATRPVLVVPRMDCLPDWQWQWQVQQVR